MNIPDFQTLMLPVLRISAKDEVKISDVVEQLATDFKLSSEERAQLLPSGRQTTFANRVHWAKSYLGKAGLVELTKQAHFQITDRGIGYAIFIREQDSTELNISYRDERNYAAKRRTKLNIYAAIRFL